MTDARSTRPTGRILAGVCAAAVGAAGAVWMLRRRRAARAAAAAAAASASRPYDVLLFDIEGTTTPISFVKETLFPYVTRTVESYLRSRYADAGTRSDIQALIDLSESDAAAGAEGVVTVPRFPSEGTPDSEFIDRQIAALVSNVSWQMSTDRKSTALKQLQGHMWRDGYVSGELRGALFGGANGDVVSSFRRWHASGLTLAIYSSGSVEAQQLLFRHSEAGDLTPLLSAYFDTKVGMKQEAKSYASIASRLGVAPQRILFLTDIYGEAAAARASGVDAVLLVRPGNYALPAEQQEKPFVIANTFDDVQAYIEQQVGRSVSAPAAESDQTQPQQTTDVDQQDVASGKFNTF